MTNEDQELRDRIARLEHELAEVKRLVASRASSPAETAQPVSFKPPEPQAPRFVPREADLPAPSAPPVLKPEPQPVRFVAEEHRPISQAQQQPQPKPRAQRISAAEQVKPLLAEPSTSRPAFDMEMLWGGRLMAFAGASVVIVGMIFAVTYLISKGMISPELQWAGELGFCAILAGLGIWKVKEKEGFGQILVGTGLASSYLSFAGAHFYKGIITYEALMAAFTLLSLGAFAFSEWRASKPFFVFGLIGGLIAGGLGFESHPGLVPALHGIALAPAILIIIRRKWLDMAYLVWPSTLVFGFVNYSFLTDHAWISISMKQQAADPDSWRILPYWAIYGVFGLAASMAYLRVHVDSKLEGGPLIAWFGPTAACLLPFAVIWPYLTTIFGFFAILALAAAHWAVSQLSGSESAREGQRLGALIAGLFVPAFSLTFDVALAVYAVEALLLAAYGFKNDSKPEQVLGNCLAVVCGTGSLYGLGLALNPDSHKPWNSLAWGLDSLPWLAAAAAMILLGLRVNLIPDRLSRWNWYGGAAALLTMRSLTSLLLWGGATQLDAFAIAGVAVLLTATTLAWLKGSLESAAAALLSAFVLLAAAISMPLMPEMGGGREVPALGLALAGVLLYGASFSRHKPEQLGLAAAGTSLAAIYPFARLTFLAATSLGADNSSAVLVGLALFGLICAALARVMDWQELTAMGALYGCAATAPYFGLEGQTMEGVVMSRPAEILGMMLLAGAVGFLWSHLHKAQPEARMTANILGSLVIGVPLVKAASLIMTMPEIGMPFWRSLLFACAVWSIITSIGSVSMKVQGLSWAGLIYFVAGLLFLVPDRVEGMALNSPWATGSTPQIASLAVLLVSSILAARSFLLTEKERDWTLGISVGVNWILASLLLGEVSQLPVFGFTLDASLTGAWVIYGTVILTLGFIKDWAALRIGGMVVFGAALVKVFFYDLAYLETIIKIFLLIGFGIVMLALSYAYVRFARTHKPTSQS